MAIAKPRLRTIVFDLDDTLYAEADYVISGKNALAQEIAQLYKQDLRAALLAEESDFIGLACTTLGVGQDAKASLLWAYRLHKPTLKPRPGAAELIAAIRARGDAVCIITDGRSVTQRLKIEALNLSIDAIYISEEIGVEKPDLTAFLRVEQDFPATHFAYVGDNVRKDFIAPNALGWLTFGLEANAQSIHPMRNEEQPAGNMPQQWVKDFAELACKI
jgi:putative hydrolase of the HAD superfamily